MGSFGRKLTHEQEKQRRRTQQGVCARCGKGPAEHTGLDRMCSDGKHSYSFAFSRDDIERMARNLEEAQASVGKVVLTRDEQRVLDELAERFIRGESSITPTVVAEVCALPLHEARAILGSLKDKGMLGLVPAAPS